MDTGTTNAPFSLKCVDPNSSSPVFEILFRDSGPNKNTDQQVKFEEYFISDKNLLTTDNSFGIKQDKDKLHVVKVEKIEEAEDKDDFEAVFFNDLFEVKEEFDLKPADSEVLKPTDNTCGKIDDEDGSAKRSKTFGDNNCAVVERKSEESNRTYSRYVPHNLCHYESGQDIFVETSIKEEASNAVSVIECSSQAGYYVSEANKLKEQDSKIVFHKIELKDQESKIVDQVCELKDQESKIVRRESLLKDQERNIVSQESELEDQESKIVGLEWELKDQENKIVRRESVLKDQERNIVSQEELKNKESKIVRQENKLNHVNHISFVTTPLTECATKLCKNPECGLFDTKIICEVKNGRKLFTCNVCSKTFQCLSKGERHIQRHRGLLSKCELCSMHFFGKKCLTYHVTVAHNGKGFECQTCHKFYNSSKYLSYHKKVVHGNYKEMCNICGRSYRYLYAHSKIHTQEHILKLEQKQILKKPTKPKKRQIEWKKNKCRYCDQGFRRSFLLRQHENVHLGIKPHLCNFCGQSFFYKKSLQRHELIHSKNLPFQCEICGSSFGYRYILETHKKIHSTIKPFKCNFCPKTFITKTYLTNHLNNAHTALINHKKLHVCMYCGKEFSKFAQLREHEILHKDPIILSCEYCKMTYPTQHSMNSHRRFCKAYQMYKSNTISIKSHQKNMKIKNNSCSKCAKVFSLKYRANHHLCIPCDSNYCCSVCNKYYSSQIALNTHKMYHINDTKLTCQYCKKIFLNKSLFRLHLRKVHTNINDYVCNLCGKHFKQKAHLLRHKKSSVHSNLRGFICDICGKGFHLKSTLIGHIQLHMKKE